MVWVGGDVSGGGGAPSPHVDADEREDAVERGQDALEDVVGRIELRRRPPDRSASMRAGGVDADGRERGEGGGRWEEERLGALRGVT